MKSVLFILMMSLSGVTLASDLNSVLLQLSNLADQEEICLNNKLNQSTYGMLKCMGERYESMDIILNREYQNIMKMVEGEEKNRLVQSQRDWLKFRVSNCSWEATVMLGGTGENVVYAGCMNNMTNQRIQELTKFYYSEY